jgi:hypothetical protein
MLPLGIDINEIGFFSSRDFNKTQTPVAIFL